MQQSQREWGLRELLFGVVLSAFFAVSTMYVGLSAGQTLSASIPAAVLSFIFMRRGNLLQHNTVQTVASAGESISAGVIFTMPALLIGASKGSIPWYHVAGVAAFGGSLGVVSMIWIRPILIVERDRELRYPEGRACARLLQVLTKTGKINTLTLVIATLIGAAMSALNVIVGIVPEKSTLYTVKRLVAGGRTQELFSLKSTISLALLAVGMLIGTNAALLMLSGGVISLISWPAYAAWHPDFSTATDLKRMSKFFGIGVMVVAAFYSLVWIVGGIVRSKLRSRGQQTNQKKTQASKNDDMRPIHQVGVLTICALGFVWLFYDISHSLLLSLTAALGVFIIGSLLSLVASYIVGQVGSTSSPTSGMTITGLIATCGILGIFREQLLANTATANVILLAVAGCICCAASTAGSVSQDLKTGYMLGATPRRQQWAMLLSIVCVAPILHPFLMSLHHTRGIGVGLEAPQAGLFKELVEAFLAWLQGKPLPFGDMILKGMILGALLAAADIFLRTRKNPPFRLSPMAVAVGIYLGISATIPIAIGGLIAYWAVKKLNVKKNELPIVPGVDDANEETQTLEESMLPTPRRTYETGLEALIAAPAAVIIAGEVVVGIFQSGAVAFKVPLPLTAIPARLDHIASWTSMALMLALAGLFMHYLSGAAKRLFSEIKASA